MSSKTIYVERLKTNEKGEWAWTPEAEQFNLSSDFGIDEDNLEKEICRMGQILVRYGSIAAELSANLKRKEEYVKLVEARLSGAKRSSYEAAGTKFTEGKLKEEVTMDAMYQQALSSMHLLRAEAVEADHWYRAAVKKADLLNALAFRQNAELKRGYGS